MWEYRKRSNSLTGQWAALCKILVGGIAPPATTAATARTRCARAAEPSREPAARPPRAPAPARSPPTRKRAA
jgi:hypothetical protein